MYISHISIKNYRNFNDFEMDLKPFTLIIGENNIGKTNLLNALGLIFSQEISVFRKRVLTIEDFNYEIRKKFREELFELLEAGKVDPKEFDDIIKPEIKIEVILIDFN
jgi:predicted ATP-dependent endonuclease of OLD family